METIFKKIYTIVQTQYHENIKFFRNNNIGQYFKNVSGQFFLKRVLFKTILTLRQNGVFKQKNKHFLEDARALVFTHNVPKYLWAEPIRTATYLINRMPSKVLNFKVNFRLWENW